MTYGDLDLQKIRDENGLDFAHFTYLKGQCSCCYGPRDMPKRYWKDGEIKDKDYTFILFKNANNGSGIRRKKDFIDAYFDIEYSFHSKEQLHNVCESLQEQFGDNYVVVKPENEDTCIIVRKK